MINIINNTMLMNALANEIAELSTNVPDSTVTDMFDGEGGIAIPVHKAPNRPTFFNDGSGDRRTMEALCRVIEHDCLAIRMTLKQAMITLSSLVTADTDAKVYGAVWVSRDNTNIRVNVLHPVIAYSLLHGLYKIDLESDGTLYIYEWKSEFQSDLKFAPEKVTEIAKNWAGIITALDASYQPSVGYRLTSSLASILQAIRNGNPIDSLRFQYNTAGGSPRMVVTPVQLFTRDMLFPYYGTLVNEKRSDGDSYVSRDLTPFGSCNINHDHGRITSWGGTCTGGSNNTVYASLMVLNNANTHSPHHSDTVCGTNEDIKVFVKVSQDYACALIDQILKTVEATDNTEATVEGNIDKDLPEF